MRILIDHLLKNAMASKQKAKTVMVDADMNNQNEKNMIEYVARKQNNFGLTRASLWLESNT